MVKTVLDSLTTPGGLWLLATLAILLLGLAAKKWPKKDITGLVYRAFLWAEKAIPDGSPEPKAMAKLDAFLKKFIEEYNKRHGKAPSKKVLEAAADKAEGLALATKTKPGA